MQPATTVQAERLMEHVRALSEQIGPRPTGTQAERRAAEYVHQTLWGLGLDSAQDHFFSTHETSGWSVIPWVALGAFAPLLGGRLGNLMGGAALLFAAKGLADALMGRPSPVAPVAAQSVSQNVAVRLRASGEAKQHLFLVAHLDTDRQRFTTPLPVPELTRPVTSLTLMGLVATGVTMLAQGLTGARKRSPLSILTALANAGLLASLINDETQPFVVGANDNASGIAVLLALAEALQAQPLAQTEVTLLFTGAAAPGSVGLQAYLDEAAPPTHNSYWVDVDMVGSGRLCYVSGHGLSALTGYRPRPRITALAARVAREQTALRVAGRELATLDEVAPLVERGYEAIRIAGYDDQGNLPHWRRADDTLAGIDPDTLTRAMHYTLALARALDESA